MPIDVIPHDITLPETNKLHEKRCTHSLGWVQRHEGRSEAGREVGRRLRYASLRARNLRRVAAQEVVHRLTYADKNTQDICSFNLDLESVTACVRARTLVLFE